MVLIASGLPLTDDLQQYVSANPPATEDDARRIAVEFMALHPPNGGMPMRLEALELTNQQLLTRVAALEAAIELLAPGQLAALRHVEQGVDDELTASRPSRQASR